MENQTRWMARAACRGMDPAVFFATDERVIATAIAVCRSCSVRAECEAYAVATFQHGIWGGTTELERIVLRRRDLGRRSA